MIKQEECLDCGDEEELCDLHYGYNQGWNDSRAAFLSEIDRLKEEFEEEDRKRLEAME